MKERVTVLEWTVFNLKLPRHDRDKNVARTYLVKLGIKQSLQFSSLYSG